MAACASFLYTLSVANAFLMSGMYKRGIVVGADKMSAIINSDDPYTAPLFGDGAGAFLVEKSEDPEIKIVSTFLKSDNNGIDKLFIKAGGSELPLNEELLKIKDNYVTMLGKDVFVNAIERMAESISYVANDAGLSLSEIDYIIPHQANQRIISAVYKKLNCNHLKFCSIIENHGNIINASIPTSYHLYKNLFGVASNIIMVAFGGGYNYGALLLKG